MHIGFDVSQTGSDKAGCGYFAHALANGLVATETGNSYSFYPSFGDFYFDRMMPLDNPYRASGTAYGPRHLTRDGARAFWDAADLEAELGRPDVVHSNNFWCPLGLRSTRLVYTLYDLGFAIEPRWTTESNRIGCFDGVFRSAAEADWVIAISEASRNDYLNMFPSFPAERIRIIYPCSRFSEETSQGTAPRSVANVGRFWLSVGTIEPRKNQRLLVEAYRRYAANTPDPLPLVLAGGKGWLMENFAEEVLSTGPGRIILTGYVSDEELVWLYRNCYANLYPSLFEGFGLPVLEGMQFGAATISSNTTSLPEVAGNAAILIPPSDVDKWTGAMLRLGSDVEERRRLSQASLARAAEFDWKDSVGKLLALYEEAAASPKRRAPLD